MRAILLCILLAGCYSPPKGSEACEAAYRDAYIANQWHGGEWARVYAHNAFEACNGR